MKILVSVVAIALGLGIVGTAFAAEPKNPGEPLTRAERMSQVYRTGDALDSRESPGDASGAGSAGDAGSAGAGAGDSGTGSGPAK